MKKGQLSIHHLVTLLHRLTGKRRWFAAFGFGICLTLALPPFALLPCAVIALTCILWLHDSCATKSSAFWLGWWFGFGHFLTGLYWISNALLIAPMQFGWLVPFALFGIAGVVAVYMGLLFVGLYYLKATGTLKVILFAVLWTLIELVRGSLFTGFPWNLLGYMWVFSTSMLQLASVFGIWGLSFLAVVFCAMPYTLGQGKRNWKPLVRTTLLIVMVGAWGSWRVGHATTAIVEGVYLRIVQGNIPQTLKWDPTQEYHNLDHYIQLSLSEGYGKVTHLIWPETAIPYALHDQSDVITSVLRPIVPMKGALISGAVHVEPDENGEIKKLWNAALILERSGRTQFYHKSHLVPFGEYIPFRSLGLPIEKITGGMIDFTPGPGPQTLSLPGFVPFSPLICYEAIFPAEVANTMEPPELLVNVTNDAWYGYSTGPFQHFESARVRAVEQGIPLVRAANTGISAMVDSYGRIIARTSLQTVAVLDVALPVALTEKTLYSRVGRIGVLVPLVLFLVYYLFKNKNRRASIRRA
jgi:apolipoprotein N-acyltransferase